MDLVVAGSNPVCHPNFLLLLLLLLHFACYFRSLVRLEWRAAFDALLYSEGRFVLSVCAGLSGARALNVSGARSKGEGLRQLSRMFCEKFQSTPGILRSSSAFMAVTSSSLVRGRLAPRSRSQRAPAGLLDDGRPVAFGPQRHEELDVVEAGRVGAVVGPADLDDDQLAPPDRWRMIARAVLGDLSTAAPARR